MKKIFISVILLVVLFSVCSCSNKNVQTKEISSDEQVELIIANSENAESFSDETIKALSVIYRTKIEAGEASELTKNFTSPSNEKIHNLVQKTKGELVQNISPNKLYVINNESTWKAEIKKSKLLEFLNKKNINLANISSISPEYDDNKNLISLSVGGKKILFSELKDEFGLKSNKITNITSSLSSIIIEGETKKEPGYFDITEAENLSKDGYDYKQLLNHFYQN